MQDPRVTRQGDTIKIEQSGNQGRDQVIEVDARQADRLRESLQRVCEEASGAHVPTGPEAEEERQDAFGSL
jgi:hypothetical protein